MMKTVSRLVRSVLVGIALGLLTACAADKATGKTPPRVEAFYGSTTLEFLRSPDRVEAFRLKENPHHGNPYTISESVTEVEGPIGVDPASARELSGILTDDQSYGWDYYKPCLPEPGVKLRFIRRTAHTDVYLCFRCGTLMDADTNRPWAMANFDPAHMKLAAAIKRIFPKTSESQLLH